MHNNCGCNEMNNCKLVLAQAHKMFKEANKYFKASEHLVDEEVINSLLFSIKALKKALMLAKKGYALEGKGMALIAQNNCQGDSAKCDHLLEDATADFIKEEEEMIEALNHMLAALEDLKESVCFRESGYEKFKEYFECVHRPEPCPPIPPVPPIPPCRPCGPCRHR